MKIVCFFFLRIRRPPRSPLFPNTTLSRSAPAPEGITNPPIDELLERTSSKYGLVIFAAKRARQINAYYSQLSEGLLEDRKSTRLNSSHANISYAVFCLKKKTSTKLPSHPT